MKDVKIIKADLNNIDKAVYLFNKYRLFYDQENNIDECKRFLLERLKNDESIIYLCLVEENAVGFMQIYKGFSSIGLTKIYILNDLYIEERYRNQKIGKLTLLKIIEMARSNNISKITLQTKNSNKIAQNLYKSLGFNQENENEFLSFYLDL